MHNDLYSSVRSGLHFILAIIIGLSFAAIPFLIMEKTGNPLWLFLYGVPVFLSMLF